MLPPLTIRDVTFDPPLFAAAMAGLTHSACRRLQASYGPVAARCTEMLAVKPILQENLDTSPHLRRRPEEGFVFYQLLAPDTDRLEAVIDRLAAHGVRGLDINCACSAPDARLRGGGCVLFEDPLRLESVLRTTRARFPGPLAVKIRLGRHTPGWEERLRDRLRLFEDTGVDLVFLHARFEEDKFRRPARPQYLAWAAALTRLPVIANGDLTGPRDVLDHPARFAGLRGLMLGRLAVVRPWLLARPDAPPAPAADYAHAWTTLCRYIAEDFPDATLALRRLRLFTAYFARNFMFGQTLFGAIQGARSLDDAAERAGRFFAADPALVREPSFSGV